MTRAEAKALVWRALAEYARESADNPRLSDVDAAELSQDDVKLLREACNAAAHGLEQLAHNESARAKGHAA